MAGGGGENADDTANPPVFPRLIAASPAKFRDYVLVPGHPSGKDVIFLGRLGFRPRNEEDARALAETYIAQARAKLAMGEYRLGEEDEFGRRYVVEIELRGTLLQSAWICRPDGTFDLATPFSGFVRRRSERRSP